MRAGPLTLFLGVVLVALGAGLAAGGTWLLMLGGSAYYVVAGAGLVLCGVLAWRGNRAASWVYATITAGTIVWAVTESGFDPWALLPRILAPAALGLCFLVRGVPGGPGADFRAAGVNAALFAVALGLLVASHLATRFQPETAPAKVLAAAEDSAGDGAWMHYGSDAGASRHATTRRINADNVTGLQPAWTYRISGLPPGKPTTATATLQTTPISIESRLYFCTATNVVIALDADSGEEIWRHDPKANIEGVPHLACRGVAYHRTPGGAGPPGDAGPCGERILASTVDNRLLAMDARSGEACADFGNGGAVDLKAGIGAALPGYHYVTSLPVVVRGVAVVGSFVFDNQSNDEPPGVVRGYDADSGDLLWAWDVLSPTAHAPLGPGESYPRSTPNVWSVPSSDEDLGLVFLPTGNTTPDFFGGHRTPEQDRYSSSIVALDVATGNVRWSFQTVYHDIWDYDIPAAPTLVDWDTPGGRIPALIAPTKRGEIFVLDRRTGKPITEVQDKPVPQGPAEGEWLAAVQPYSTGFPSLAPENLTEASMWGMSPVDQLWCRLRFKRSRYEGPFTPQSTRGTITFPGAFGVINWGGASLDPDRNLLVVNTSYLPWYQQLIERQVADEMGVVPYQTQEAETAQGLHGPEIYYAQAGTPYAIDSRPFLSPLGFPCNQPPWGQLTAIDLATRTIAWQRPLGTTRDHAPLGLPLPTGVFNIGGPLTTAGGLVFIGATIDNYLRAFDVQTGAELWRGRLPAGGQASPMSHVSSRTGRQYVVIAAGGHVVMRTTPGDYLVAYALPEKP